MKNIHTSIVVNAHGYTRSKVPWELDAYQDAHGETSKGVRFGWKLFHYLAGGGMRIRSPVGRSGAGSHRMGRSGSRGMRRSR